MRLFVRCPRCERKIYLSLVANSRRQIPSPFNAHCGFCNESYSFYRMDVIAESGGGGAIGGAIIGGLIGLLGGPLGLILGGLAGGGLGASADADDQNRADAFNREVVY